MKQWLLILMLFPFCALAQEDSVKVVPKTPYQLKLEEAHQQFEKKRYKKAISVYEEALELRPNDPFALAKINDLNIIIEEQKRPKKKEEPKEPTPEELAEKRKQEQASVSSIMAQRQAMLKRQGKEVPEPQPEEKKEVVKEPEIKEEPKQEGPKEEMKEEKVVEVKEEPVKKEPVKEEPKETPEPKKEVKEEPKKVVKKEVKEPPKVDKSTEEYKEYLGETYPEGVTEEVYKQGSATVTKRIVVKDGKGNEYRRAVHTWGGKFYFKNDTPISGEEWEKQTTLK